MYFTYILLSQSDGRTYVGFTKDMVERLRRHNSGQVSATKNRRPLVLFYLEKFSTMKEAKEKELWWKTSGGRKEMKKLFSDNINKHGSNRKI